MNNNILHHPGEKVSVDTVYSEMYNEMRRHREYQFSSAKWYTTLFLALIGAIFAAKYSGQSPGIKNIIDSNEGIRCVIILVAILICLNSCHTILYSHWRYSELRRYADIGLEPKWKTFLPKKIKPQPHVLLVFSQAALAFLAIISLYLPV